MTMPPAALLAAQDGEEEEEDIDFDEEDEEEDEDLLDELLASKAG